MSKPPEPSYAGCGAIVYMAQFGSQTTQMCDHHGDPSAARVTSRFSKPGERVAFAVIDLSASLIATA
jgi:hypothetical protein